MGLLTSTKTASGSIAADPALVYEILTDYDAYSEWIPAMSYSKLLAREGDLAIAEFQLTRPHRAKFAVECIHTKNKEVLTRTISGEVPLAQVHWTLQPAEPGHTQVQLKVDAKRSWKRLLPGYWKFINLPACLKALQSQTSAYSADFAVADPGGEKILEIAETPEGLVCWYRGKKYTLKPE